MNYLDQLHALDAGEKFTDSPKREPAKPSKGGFVGFVGSTSGTNENIFIGTDEDSGFQNCTYSIPTKPSKGHEPLNDRIQEVIDELRANPGLRCAIKSHDGIETDPVILSVAIRGKAACELHIPKSRYDGLALLEIIERYTTGQTLQ